MKIKKTSLIAVGIAIVLLAGITTVFATSAKGSADNNPPALNTTVELPKELAEKYAPLLTLRFDGYENMTVAEYREKVLTIIDNAEYMGLLEDMTRDMQLQEMRYTNDAASFFLNTFIPVIAEKWEQREYAHYVKPANNAGTEGGILEYTITRTILDAEQLTMGQHEQAIQGMMNGLQSFWQGKNDVELQDEATMDTAIKEEIERLKKQWETTALQLDTTYFFSPLRIHETPQGNLSNEDDASEQRSTPGTEADYQSLLALKTPDYQNLSVADFNMTVLEWANADYERNERVNIDIGWNDIRVPLTDEERAFATLTVRFSGEENATLVWSHHTSDPRQDPVIGYSLTKERHPEIWCNLYYQLTYHITDENRLTVGERDRCLGGVINGISSFWEGTRIEELVAMSEQEVTAKLKTIASEYSNDLIKIDFGQTHFESMDESAYRR